MSNEEWTEEEYREFTRAKTPSTDKELSRKAQEYIMKKAEEANGKPLKSDLPDK